ncbi:CAP domain-containing protein [Butyrivibrio sp. NC3005]|uniref:CAP domain-containing protein n=1 Tax=Butyrivibrio sp. NC3005 TaxID=1280685 RepID=UPI0004070729|nr:CAP domain-containing protein [Butyrivibrio sp. NC3005]
MKNKLLRSRFMSFCIASSISIFSLFSFFTIESKAYTDGYICSAPIVYGSNSYFVQSNIARTNQFRNELSLPALTENAALDAIALERANDMIQNHYFGHYKNGIIMAFSIDTKYGIEAHAENIYYYYLQGPDSTDIGSHMANGWRNSEGHYRNIINASYTQIGVAMVLAPDGSWYGVQIFS